MLDCHNNCAPAGWSGDGVCDDPDTEYGAYYYNCAKLSFDGGASPPTRGHTAQYHRVMTVVAARGR